MAVMYLCKATGCDNLVEKRGYCSIHAHLQREDDERKLKWSRISNAPRPEYAELYNSYRWKKCRKEFLEDYPICFVCGGRSEVVDHAIPHRGNEELFYDRENWQALCSECHNKKTRKEVSARAHKKVINDRNI